MKQLKLTDLSQDELVEYIKKTRAIENDMCWLLKAYYYCRALVNNNYLYKRLDFKNDGIDHALYNALEQFSRLNKISVILTLYKLLFDTSKKGDEHYILKDHFEHVKELYRKRGLILPIEKIKCNKFKNDIRFARNKFVAHSESIRIDEFRDIDIFQYQDLISEMVSKYNQTLLTGTVNFNGKIVNYVPITMELMQDIILDCNNGVAAMLSHVHN